MGGVTDDALDELVLEAATVTAAYRAAAEEANEAVREGFWAMADARHAVGRPHLLKRDAYDRRERMRATLAVGDDGELVERAAEDDAAEGEGEESDGEEGPEQKQLVRRRVLKAAEADQPSKLSAAVAVAAGEREPEPPAEPLPEEDLSRNPMAWFGVLLPPDAVRARERFRHAAACLARAAQLSRRLRDLEEKKAAALAGP